MGREETLKSGRNLQLKYNSLQVKRSKDIPERRKKGNVTHSAARVEERGFVNGSGKVLIFLSFMTLVIRFFFLFAYGF